MLPENVQIGIEYPNSFSVVEEGMYTYGSNSYSIRVTDASGVVKIDNPPPLIRIMLPLVILPLLSALLYMLWVFKSFTQNVKTGSVFHMINIRYLKRISYLLVGIWLYLQLLVTLYNTLIISKFNFESITFSHSYGGYGSILLFALFLWVLSHIFEKGAEIETDNQLTI